MYRVVINPFAPKSDFIDFTLSNARRFSPPKGDPLGVKGLKKLHVSPLKAVSRGALMFQMKLLVFDSLHLQSLLQV